MKKYLEANGMREVFDITNRFGRNNDLVDAFVYSTSTEGMTANHYFKNNVLVSYYTPVAVKLVDGHVLVTNRSYSKTTSTLVNKVKREVAEYTSVPQELINHLVKETLLCDDPAHVFDIKYQVNEEVLKLRNAKFTLDDEGVKHIMSL